MRNSSDAKITQNDLTVLPYEQVFRFEITMDQLTIMGILQGLRHLSNVARHGSKWDFAIFGMTITQRPAGSVIHDEIGSVVSTLYSKVDDTDNMRMFQARDGFCKKQKPFLVDSARFRVQEFDGCLQVSSLDMPTQIDLCEASASQKQNKTIVPNLLPYLVKHCYTSSHVAFP